MVWALNLIEARMFLEPKDGDRNPKAETSIRLGVFSALAIAAICLGFLVLYR